MSRPVILFLSCLVFVSICMGTSKKRLSSPKGGEFLLASMVPTPSLQLVRDPPNLPMPHITSSDGIPFLLYYFAATATDTAGLESDYSNEVILVDTNFHRFVTLAWCPSPCTNVITNYIVYWGPAPHTYTNHISAGTNLDITIALWPPGPSNILVRVTSTGATNLAWATSFAGPWTKLNATNWTGTNVQGTRFWRALARTSGSRVYVTTSRF